MTESMNRAAINQVCGDHALLQEYAEGALASPKARIVREHIASCRACRTAVSEYKQIMWDLSRPQEVDLPPELERSYEALVTAWKNERQTAAQSAKNSATLVPAWAYYSVSWTRNLPAVGSLGTMMRRAGSSLVVRSMPRWLRRKGGGRH